MTMSHNTWQSGTDKNAKPQKKMPTKIPAPQPPVPQKPMPNNPVPKSAPKKVKATAAVSGKETLVGEPPEKKPRRTVRVMRSALPPDMSLGNPAFLLDGFFDGFTK